MDIRNWYFESNQANGNGGSLYLQCPSYDNCEYEIFHNSFLYNNASISGGAIKLNDV